MYNVHLAPVVLEGGTWTEDGEFPTPCQCSCHLFLSREQKHLKDVINSQVQAIIKKVCCYFLSLSLSFYHAPSESPHPYTHVGNKQIRRKNSFLRRRVSHFHFFLNEHSRASLFSSALSLRTLWTAGLLSLSIMESRSPK